jgi:hypothetical protein
VMAGGFGWARLLAQPWAVTVMILVVPGVVLAAAYNLRMLQRVAYGGTRNPDHSSLKDLGGREILTLVPLLVLVFWIGLNPRPFTRVLHASVENLVAQVERRPDVAIVRDCEPAGIRSGDSAERRQLATGSRGIRRSAETPLRQPGSEQASTTAHRRVDAAIIPSSN